MLNSLPRWWAWEKYGRKIKGDSWKSSLSEENIRGFKGYCRRGPETVNKSQNLKWLSEEVSRKWTISSVLFSCQSNVEYTRLVSQTTEAKTLYLMWCGGASVAWEPYSAFVCLDSSWPWPMTGGHPSVASADTQARHRLVLTKSQLYIRANMSQRVQLPYSFDNDGLAMVDESQD